MLEFLILFAPIAIFIICVGLIADSYGRDAAEEIRARRAEKRPTAGRHRVAGRHRLS